MAHLFDVLTVLIGIILTMVGWTYKSEKSRIDSNVKELQDKHEVHIAKVATIEAKLVTEKEVREIFNECLEPIKEDVKETRADMKEIRHALSHFPKRRDDNGT